MDKPTDHERHIAFLKAHEAEMTEYIKNQNQEIETVEYEWTSAEVGNIENGTLQGAGKVLVVEGYGGNQKEKHSFRLAVQTVIKELGKINKLYLISDSFDLFGESRAN